MIFLSGATIVRPDGHLEPGTLTIERDRIVDILPGRRAGGERDTSLDLRGHYVLPGFVDVHVHGLEGHDVLDAAESVAEIARRLPRYGVTAFRPTTVACDPRALGTTLEAVARIRNVPPRGSALVLPAHLESNFISPDYRGAQPAGCLRQPPRSGSPAPDFPASGRGGPTAFSGEDIVAEIARRPAEVGVVTLAPELPGASDLMATLRSLGIAVSLGHSAASFDQAHEAFAAGALRATHLFNRMAPLQHRSPGLAGAALSHEPVIVELIGDGLHVHPGVIRMTVRAKRPTHVMAVSDGTAGAGLPPGSTARLGGQTIAVREGAAYLADGTLAGSVATLDLCFRTLTGPVGLSLCEAASLCATTPAREAGLTDRGALVPGTVADLVVLDPTLRVARTFVGGEQVFEA